MDEIDPTFHDFIPDPQLMTNDNDIYRLWLTTQGIRYTKSISDPWFSAHQPTGRLSSQSIYKANEVTPPLGCKAQYEICFLDANCSSLMSSEDIVIHMDTSVKFGDMPTWFSWAALANFDLRVLVTTLSGAMLRAKYQILQGYSYGLPENQWQIEVEQMFQLLLAAMQMLVVDTAKGPSGELVKFIHKPSNTQRFLCQNQVIFLYPRLNLAALMSFRKYDLRHTPASPSLVLVLVLGLNFSSSSLTGPQSPFTQNCYQGEGVRYHTHR